jgi:hypothetical protein
METLEATHSLSADTSHGELHFTIGGLWNEQSMVKFLQEMNEVAKPLIEAGRGFVVMGDLRDFVPQNRETAAAIENSIAMGKKLGLRKFAVVSSSALVKLQYRRIAKDMVIDFFEEPRDALAWLRRA